MKLNHYSEMPPVHMNNDVAKGVTGRIAIGKADGADHFCMRVFELSRGGHTPLHVHEWEHEIFVYQGAGEVYHDGKWHALVPGYTVLIPGNEEHQIRNAGDGPFIFVCLIPSGAPEM